MGLQAGSCIQSCRGGTRRKCGRPAVVPSSVLPPLSSCRSPVVRDRGSPSVGPWGSSETHLAVCPLLCLSACLLKCTSSGAFKARGTWWAFRRQLCVMLLG